MKKDGFTLIEMIVVMAIISIMAGIMIPLVYRTWESGEIELTKDRMNALKTAMVGDPRLMQNGVRTSFGYIGDIGQLPASLDNLVTNPGVSNWKGAYLQTGFGVSDFKTDAWKNQFYYSTSTDASARRVSATLTSLGSDGVAGNATGSDTANDITITIDANETFPASSINGNIRADFSTPPQTVQNYSAKAFVKYRDGVGGLYETFCCVPVTIPGSPGNTIVNYSTAYSCNLAENLPVGAAVFKAVLFSDTACSVQIVNQTASEAIVNVNDRVGAVTVNLQLTVQ